MFDEHKKHIKTLRILMEHPISVKDAVTPIDINEAIAHSITVIEELKALRKDCYIIPKGDENRKEEIILHNLICRDANISDCEQADIIARVIVKDGYIRYDKVSVSEDGKKRYEISPKTLDEMCRRLGYVKKERAS